MESILLLVSIARTIGQVLSDTNVADTDKAQWFTYLNLATGLAEKVMTVGDAYHEGLKLLDEQLKTAVREGRGLTAIERAQWRERDDAATAIAQKWLDEHPKN